MPESADDDTLMGLCDACAASVFVMAGSAIEGMIGVSSGSRVGAHLTAGRMADAETGPGEVGTVTL
ncbi:MAG: hypothetical protein VB858_02820, partial [Planctomycetaceae bacterium]